MGGKIRKSKYETILKFETQDYYLIKQTNMETWESFKKELLKNNKEVAKEYERLKPYYQLIAQLIEARMKSGMTQEELANKIGTKQSVIARVESVNSNPTFAFIDKIVNALGSKLIVEIK